MKDITSDLPQIRGWNVDSSSSKVHIAIIMSNSRLNGEKSDGFGFPAELRDLRLCVLNASVQTHYT